MKKIVIALLVFALLPFLPLAYFDLTAVKPSLCIGETNSGRIENAVRPAVFGANYRPYCYLCVLALRTYGESDVIRSMRKAYQSLAKTHPQTRFIYGEIGWPWGGRFRPHRTHQNGLSVDFMVPLKNGATIPTNIFNRFGYDVVFDATGNGPAGEIDFAALAAHLTALNAAARARGHNGSITRVILAPDLQDNLFKAPGGAKLRTLLRFNKNPSWVRHDDHYHVDFDFPCWG